jgi:hypothetical protein
MSRTLQKVTAFVTRAGVRAEGLLAERDGRKMRS